MPALYAPRLRSLLQDIAASIAAGVHALIDRKVECREGQLQRTSLDALASELPVPSVLVRGTPAVRFVIDAATAITMAACMRMESAQTVDRKRAAATLTNEDLESFGDVATGMCSAAHSALRKALDDQGELRLEETRAVDPDSGWREHLEDGPFLCYRVPIRIEEGPESALHIIVDVETATLWNGAPLDGPEEIRQAPIRGKLAAYLVDPEVLEVVKKACRRVGLELVRHPSTAIPNPAAHKGELVLMDVPTGEERRFSWCKRLADHPAKVETILIVHHPSRNRIVQAFTANAEAILGWPITEAELSAKITAVLDEDRSPSAVDG
jgi:CheY-like chemotaxis protein